METRCRHGFIAENRPRLGSAKDGKEDVVRVDLDCKGTQGPCFERNQAVGYLGPFKEVLDDDGHRLVRGRRHAVCDKTYQLYKQEPYRAHFAPVDPLRDIPLADAKPFDCAGAALRHPRQTKGGAYNATTTAAAQCRDGGSCC